MTTPPKHYKLVATNGHCAILAQIIGTEPTGEEIPTFFAAFMLTKDCKPAISFAECDCMVRVSKDVKYDDSLIGFCKGYSQAAQERRGGMSPQDWTHKQTIDAKDVEELAFNSPEQRRLRAWPMRPEDGNFILRPIEKNDLPPHEAVLLTGENPN